MTIGVLGNLDKPDAATAIASLLAILERRSIGYVLLDTLRSTYASLCPPERFLTAEQLLKTADVAVAFGGDGTMLADSRFLAGSGVPLLGVNLGRLGFLAEFSVDALEQMIEELVAGRIR